ncbi:hypothetical protein J4G08_09405 [Candidatus Poribacteria bacterium]|nr:hypothetical protein [Candidatus Poribacteria bacterium]
MVRTVITFLILLIGITLSFSDTIAETKWTVLRDDDIIRGDGIQGMLHDVHFWDNQNGLVIGDSGLMLVTADGGKTWTKKEVNMRPPGATTGQRPGRPPGAGGPPAGFGGGGSPTLYNIYFVNEKVGYITGARGTILKTEDNGKTWNRKIARSEAAGQNNNPRRGGIRANLMGIQIINETVGFIVGSENTILKTTDGGETWVGRSERARVGETRNNLEDIWFVTPTTGWIVGSYGTLLHTTDGGETWEKREAGFDNNLFGIYFFDEKTGWICGQEGLILHTNDGKTWNQQKTGSIDNLHDIIFVDNMIGWTVGDYSAVLHTTDGGKTWGASKAGGSGTLKGVYATDKNHCWTVDDWGVISAYKTK